MAEGMSFSFPSLLFHEGRTYGQPEVVPISLPQVSTGLRSRLPAGHRYRRGADDRPRYQGSHREVIGFSGAVFPLGEHGSFFSSECRFGPARIVPYPQRTGARTVFWLTNAEINGTIGKSSARGYLLFKPLVS